MAHVFRTSNNIFFKTIHPLEQKLNGRHQGKTETLICSNHSIQISKMTMHYSYLGILQIISSKPYVLSSWNQATWRLRMNKIILFRYQRWSRTKQQSWYSSNSIFLQTICPHEQKPDRMRKAKRRLRNDSFIPLKYKRWSWTKQPSQNSSTSSKPYIFLSRNLMEGFRQHGDSEIAKINPLTHQRLPCSKQPSCNFSSNIFQTIYPLEQKLDRRLTAIWRLRNSKKHPIHTLKMPMH